MNTKIKVVILAAGKGKRMQSENPKVLAQVKGKAMIKHLLETVQKSGVSERTCIVVGHGKEDVIKELGEDYDYVVQEEQLGTGHALLVAQEVCKDAEYVVALYGDQPFISADSIKKMTEKHLSSGAEITFTTIEIKDFEDWRKVFTHWGRVLRKESKIIGIREYKDANEEEKNIKELNVGPSIFNADWLWKNLEKLKNDNVQKEYYLTDLIKLAIEEGEKVESMEIIPHEALGANSKEELDILESFII